MGFQLIRGRCEVPPTSVALGFLSITISISFYQLDIMLLILHELSIFQAYFKRRQRTAIIARNRGKSGLLPSGFPIHMSFEGLHEVSINLAAGSLHSTYSLTIANSQDPDLGTVSDSIDASDVYIKQQFQKVHILLLLSLLC